MSSFSSVYVPRPATTGATSLRDDVGQLLCVGFGGHTAEGDITRLVRDYSIGSVILFRRNCHSAEQIATLNADLQAARPLDTHVLVGIDQEGGAVARLRGIATDFPPMAVLGAIGDEGLAHAYGTSLAEELTALGIGIDFAPVVDVNTNPDNPVIGTRAFGADPHLVAKMAAAQIRGMEAGGLIACAKHFPGHGDTLTDSHKGMPIVPHDMERLDAVELLPFRRAISAGVPAIMTAHVQFPAVDKYLPATLSPAVVDGLLRQRLGFEGVVATDDLEMAAIVDGPGIEKAVILGLEAGVDLFLICHRIERQVAAFEALVRLGEKSVEHRRRIQESAARIRLMKERVDPELTPSPQVAPQWLRGGHSRALAMEIERRGAQALAETGQELARSPDPTSAPDLKTS